MPSADTIKNTFIGLLIVIVFAAIATLIAGTSTVRSVGLSPVVIGIIVSMVCGNFFSNYSSFHWRKGIQFSAKFVLRAAIIFYGFRITLQNIVSVGLEGFLVSVIMVVSTFSLGIFLGKKVFKMDPDLALLTACGSAVCGAAAVLGMESVLRSEPYKSAVAVSTVVLFGTLSMFIYPALYHTGILNMTTDVFGIYIGGSIHEVAQVVVAGNGVNEASADTGMIVKMTRVMMLAPLLLVTGGFLFSKHPKTENKGGKFPIPYFVLAFILVVGFNSLDLLPKDGVNKINTADTFLLTMAMCAIGMETRFSKFKEAGTQPIYLATLLFAWLLLGGFAVTKFISSAF